MHDQSLLCPEGCRHIPLFFGYGPRGCSSLFCLTACWAVWVSREMQKVMILRNPGRHCDAKWLLSFLSCHAANGLNSKIGHGGTQRRCRILTPTRAFFPKIDFYTVFNVLFFPLAASCERRCCEIVAGKLRDVSFYDQSYLLTGWGSEDWRSFSSRPKERKTYLT